MRTLPLVLACLRPTLVAAEQGKAFTGEAAIGQENDLFKCTLPAVKADPEKTAALRKAHAFAQQNYPYILPRSGVSEAARVKEMEKRRDHLTKLVEKLAQ